MYQPNYERIAQKIIQDSLRVRPGEHGVLSVRSDAVSYAEMIAAAIFRAGGTVTVLLQSDEVKYHQLMDTPLEQLPLPWQPNEAAIYASDFNIAIGLNDAEPERFHDIPAEREHAFNRRRNSRSHAIYREGGPRWVGTDYPTRYIAQSLNVPWNRLFETFWRAMDVDYERLYAQAAALGERLGRGEQYRITSPRGTDLRFRRGERRIFRDDGRVVDIGNLPAGEVTFSPIEESVEGRFVADESHFRGQRVDGLTLHFEGGVGTPQGATRGFELFMEQWEAATGEKDRLGEVGIGINPELTSSVGYELTDQKVYGLVHLTLGENEITGGENRGTLRWTSLVQQATFYVDDEPVLERGRFVAGLLR